MPRKHLHGPAAQQTEAGFIETFAAICRGNFLVVTCINMLLMTDYYLIFVTGTAHVQKTFGTSLSTAGLTSGIMVIGCLVGRFLSGNQLSTFGGNPACLRACCCLPQALAACFWWILCPCFLCSALRPDLA